MPTSEDADAKTERELRQAAYYLCETLRRYWKGEAFLHDPADCNGCDYAYATLKGAHAEGMKDAGR